MPEFLRNNCVTMKEFEKIIILHVGPFGSWGNIFKRGGGLSLSRLFPHVISWPSFDAMGPDMGKYIESGPVRIQAGRGL